MGEELRVERVVAVVGSFEDAAAADRSYWLAQSSAARFAHVERLRRANYVDDAATRLQRVLEVARRPPR